MPILNADHIRKNFRQPDGSESGILENIGLTIEAGEIVCLLGASGCGKTTLLRILAGTDRDFDGSVTSAVVRPGPELGYLSQSDRLLPWRTALENTRLGLELCGLPVDGAVAALAQTGLAAFAGHYPAQLSGGMQQRVLLARMLALKPRLLLLDEPMSSLDVPARQDLAAIIKNYVRDHKAAALVVTHSVEEACFLADHILLISRRPARIGGEIRLADAEAPGLLARDKAMDQVMSALRHSLRGAA